MGCGPCRSLVAHSVEKRDDLVMFQGSTKSFATGHQGRQGRLRRPFLGPLVKFSTRHGGMATDSLNDAVINQSSGWETFYLE